MKTLSKMWALVALTTRESLAKKTFLAFFALSTLLHLFFVLALNVDIVDGALAMVKIMGKDLDQNIDVNEMIIGVQTVIATMVFSGGIFLSIFATASLVPNMLEKGSIDLLISKPLSRPQILLARFLGAQSIMALNVVYLIGGSWLILSWKTGVWHLPYLYSIPMVIIAFAVMYAIMTFIGVTTRSSGVSVMVAYTILFFSPFLVQKDRIYAFLSDKVYYYFLEGLYHALPRTFELGEINQALVRGQSIESWAALWNSCLTGTLVFGAAVWFFSKKDF